MSTPHRLYVGTIGEGLYRSLDGGESFRRTCEGMFVECQVRALAVDPEHPAGLYLGSEHGVFHSDNGADSWKPLPAPLGGLQVWSLSVDARRPGRILVGTCPARIFLSEDGGQTWGEANLRTQQGCPKLYHTRLTCLLVDPQEPESLWAGVEIDGVFHSGDGGRTWHARGEGLSSQDIHALVLVPAGKGQPRRLLAATNNDLNLSQDDGLTWQPAQIGQVMPWSYCRALGQKQGEPDVLFLGNGDAPPGEVGTIGVSRDGGGHWQATTLPTADGRANSTIWSFATHPADAELIYAASVSGQVFCSRDGGQSWIKIRREFGEIRALAWAPLSK
jgi:photosystem II stability/assembly factor-like uncharacterized protein